MQNRTLHSYFIERCNNPYTSLDIIIIRILQYDYILRLALCTLHKMKMRLKYSRRFFFKFRNYNNPIIRTSNQIFLQEKSEKFDTSRNEILCY